jgi:hypothetical protein
MRIEAAVLGGALLAAAASGVASDALACGFADYREYRPIAPKPKPLPASDRIAAAEQRLEEDRLADAAGQVVAAFPRIQIAGVGQSPLETHAARILALALVRGEGTLAGTAGFSGTTERQRSAQLGWAVSTLRAVSESRGDDPVAQADLAEALASRPATEDQAIALLDDLAARDLLGSAHAYATLARLRSKTGDAGKVRAALERCELMTKSPSAVCKSPDTRVAMR